MTKRKTHGLRRQNVSSHDNPIYHAIGPHQIEDKGLVFGALMTYTPGTDPLCLVDDDLSEDVILEKLSAPIRDDGKRREFLASMMYFGVMGDHMALMQSQALKSSHLESYLQWLLHSAEVLEGTNTFQLDDKPSQALQKKLASGGGVRSIKVGSELAPPALLLAKASASPGSPASQHLALQATATADGQNHGILEALKKLMSPAEVAKIDFDKLADSNIEMSVTLRYRSSTTEDGQKLMDTLGSALRHVEDLETELQLVGGGSIKGDELKLNGSIRVNSYDGQLSPTEVYEGLRQWLLEKVNSKELATS